jgi:hypothetical protein
VSLEGWENSHQSFLIDPLNNGSRLLTVVKQSDCEWIRATLGDEAGNAADLGPIEISADVVQEFVDEAVAQKRWVLDYTKATYW